MVEDEVGAQRGEGRRQRPASVIGCDLRFGHRDDGACVQTLLHEHEAHAGGLVAGEDRPLDRSCSPPQGQQREVHVDEAEAGGRQRRRRQDPPVRDDQTQIDPGRVHHREQFVPRRRLSHLEPELLGGELDRRRLRPVRSPLRRIGTGHDHIDVGDLHQGDERGDGRTRRAEERCSHSITPEAPGRAPRRAARAAPDDACDETAAPGGGCRRGDRPRAGAHDPSTRPPRR